MRTFKRNAVILTVVLFVCVAAYLNWSYNKESGGADDLGAISATDNIGDKQLPADDPVDTGNAGESAVTPDAGLFYTQGSKSDETVEYFAATRLNRQQARDTAAETLITVSTTDGASQEIVDAALGKITALAAASQKEAELESIIMAKGFSDCVVFLSEEGVKVTVPSPMEGLSQTQVAQIKDVILAETDYAVADMEVIPFINK